MPLGRKTPMGKLGWRSMLSVADGGLTSIPWEDLDSTLVQTIQRESDGLALGDLKNRLRPQGAIETIPGEGFIVISTLCVCCASPAACCWCRVSCCLFLMRKMFYLLKYNQSRITQAREKQVEVDQDQSMKGCSHNELDKDNYQQ